MPSWLGCCRWPRCNSTKYYFYRSRRCYLITMFFWKLLAELFFMLEPCLERGPKHNARRSPLCEPEPSSFLVGRWRVGWERETTRVRSIQFPVLVALRLILAQTFWFFPKPSICAWVSMYVCVCIYIYLSVKVYKQIYKYKQIIIYFLFMFIYGHFITLRLFLSSLKLLQASFCSWWKFSSLWLQHTNGKQVPLGDLPAGFFTEGPLILLNNL